uniref:CUB domain-containing protein n=1 Tax=Romanomermis culicivorax TaxID=13658 RepID=A0A915KS77_ROMCU
MWIKFSSNGLESGKGFSVAYTAKCGKVFRGTSGKIQSPNFPNPVGAPRRCEYIIEAPETYAISINFSFADFGNPVPYNCTANYIEASMFLALDDFK